MLNVQLMEAISVQPLTGVVMVVDDSAEFRNLVVSMLSMEAYVKSCHVASSGEQAIEDIGVVNPELVLLDFRLGGINGLETAKIMKDKNPQVKIAILTAYADEVLGRYIADSCVAEVIPKTLFSPERIRKLMGQDTYGGSQPPGSQHGSA